MPPTDSSYPTSESDARRRRSDRTPGAWAAAAVVIAVGALIFAVSADRRASSLVKRVAALETDVADSAVAVERSGSVPRSSTTASDVVEDPLVAGERPADVEAASAEIRELVDIVFGREPTTGQVVDDPTGVDEASAGFAAEGGATRIAFSSVDFTSSTDGFAEFRIYHDGGRLLDDQRVEAVAIGSAWRLTRESVCLVFDRLGFACAS